MKHIWSPWRMKFIEKARKGHKCIFCNFKFQISDTKKKRGKDMKDLILYRGISCYIMMNRYPYNNGHLMVIPYAHKAMIDKLEPWVQEEFIRLTGESARILKKVLKCDGVNCGINIGHAAGAGIAGHIHMHVVPRWQGDYNFFPVIGNAKSMPEHLEATYKKLKPAFDKI